MLLLPLGPNLLVSLILFLNFICVRVFSVALELFVADTGVEGPPSRRVLPLDPPFKIAGLHPFVFLLQIKVHVPKLLELVVVCAREARRLRRVEGVVLIIQCRIIYRFPIHHFQRKLTKSIYFKNNKLIKFH